LFQIPFKRGENKKMLKKLTLIVSLLLVLSLALVACGGGTSDAEPEAPLSEEAEQDVAEAEEDVTEEEMEEAAGEEATSGDVVELQLMGWASSDAENTRLQAVVDSFNDAHQDIHVNLNLVPDYDTKLQTSLAGGSPPDVFYVDSFK
jgi:ABC-type glycerol-3-phosphate transport system substrate-binding protein